jgi:uncharacterized membrane protein
MLVSIVSFIITVLAIILVALNVIKSNYYKIAIYVVGLFVVWPTTLLGVFVVGSDISREVTMSVIAAKNGWDLSIWDVNNTSFVIGWLVPFLSKILFVDIIWVYKVILPMIFATTPVILYAIFRRQIDSKLAFYAAIFFIIMPVYSLEIPTIGKSMVAEPLFALFIYAMIVNWNKWLKAAVLLVLLLLIIWAHYTIGILALCFLLGIIAILAISKIFKNWKIWYQRTVPIWMLCIVLLSGLSLGIYYYSNVARGQLWQNLGIISGKFSNLSQSIVVGNYTYGEYEFFGSAIPEQGIPQGNTSIFDVKNSYLNKQGVFIRAAVGLDFLETTIAGKVFRIFQFITQALIIIGCCFMLSRRKGFCFTAEFLAGVGTAAFLLLYCIFMPYFSGTINMTRFYHISLFFLAPAFVIGAEAISGAVCRD